ncbi:O-antigen/teichoic acid export membrane protein [Metabacillus crassostreae]|uniref:lipopolysaccharide biosynthesis protein n=1 Tax=Metabacillus crassostreae TaxID=929098 RepID=UPI0019580F43|nr:oligosaccharide flippase family protein [Metabacillus crassostreae]MBM7606289.1 O-antigen/teichoic acid export membrane protein [Metabacillus crassostreae]
MGLNSYKKLLNNSLIFALGDIGSKGITLLLVPLYTFYLSQSEYGLIDVIQVTINLIVPIVSLSIFEAVLRFVMDKKDISSIFTNCFFITCISSLFTIFVFTILYFIGDYNHNILPYVCIVIVLQLFQLLYSQFIRGIGKVSLFAFNGLLIALTTALMSLVFIVWLNQGIEGYLLSIIIGLSVSVIYINLRVNTFKFIKFSSLSLNISRNLLSYSLPLMPNSIMWWIINASSRYFILIFAGPAHNGLFAVASKIPSLLSIFNSIFFKAWQLSAIEEYDSKDKAIFYSRIFNFLQQFLFIVTAAIVLFLKFIFEYALESNFFTAWKYVPFLLIAVLFSCFSSFLGTNYIASKETSGVFKTSLIGGITNLVLNMITIPIFGAIGASFSSMISFLVMAIIRWHDTKKYIIIKYNYRNLFYNMSLILMQITTMYLSLDRIIEFTVQLFLFCLILLNNKEVIKSAVKLLKFQTKKN